MFGMDENGQVEGATVIMQVQSMKTVNSTQTAVEFSV